MNELDDCLALATALYEEQGNVSIGVQKDDANGCYIAWIEISTEQTGEEAKGTTLTAAISQLRLRLLTQCKAVASIVQSMEKK